MGKQTVPIALPTSSFTPMEENLHSNLFKIKELQKLKNVISHFRYIDNILLIDNPIFVDWIQLQYSKEVEIKERSEAASSPPLLEYTYNFIPKVIFLPDFLAKETTYYHYTFSTP
jgi:hypothetical protein